MVHLSQIYYSDQMPFLLRLTLLFLSLVIGGCNIDFQNARPARELTSSAQQGNVHAGWRVFQDKCSSCHGVSATGSEQAPDLLPIVRTMNLEQFAAVILNRYDLAGSVSSLPMGKATAEASPDKIVGASTRTIDMPTWRGEPTVNAHILDLYTYLSERADGRIGIGRPPYYRSTSGFNSGEPLQ